MSDYLHVENPFFDQLAELGSMVIDQDQGIIPLDPAKRLRPSFRGWFLPEVFHDLFRAVNMPRAGDTDPAKCSWKEHGSRPSQCRFECRRKPEAACPTT